MKKYNKKLINSWIMYDWANSVYNLVISSAIFPIFYESYTKNYATKKIINGNELSYVNFFGFEIINTALISYIMAFGLLVVSFITPILSGIADYTNNKSIFLRFFIYLGAICTSLIFFFNIDNIELSLIIYLLGLISFWSAFVFYNAYLVDLVPKVYHNVVSSKGYSMGYLGSVILLIICLILINFNDKISNIVNFDISKELATRISFLLTGIWWIVFSQNLLLKLKDENRKKISKNILFNGFKELKKVFSEIIKIKQLKRFLISFFFISAGVQSVMLVATYFAAKEIKWQEGEKETGLIISILLIQIIAIIGAWLTSILANKRGNIFTMKILTFMWMLITFYAYTIEYSSEFYIAACFVGLVMGGIQSISRSTFSMMLPNTNDSSSYFSMHSFIEKIAMVVGLFLYGALESITGSMRNSILILVLIFIFAFISLFFVKYKNSEVLS